MQDQKVDQYTLERNGAIPNNPQLPLLLYKKLFIGEGSLKDDFEKAFKENKWGGTWINGIYDYHHYHSTSHEALGVLEGEAVVIFGGEGGIKLKVLKGDMVVIPAGVGHCCMEASDDFKVIGAYPESQEDYDICTEKDDPEEKIKNINTVSLPQNDPVDGVNGKLMEAWYQ